MDQPRQLYGERFRAQAPAVASAAERGGHVLRHPLAIGIGIGFLEIAFEKFQNALEAETLFAAGDGLSGCVARALFSSGGRIAVEEKVLDAGRIFFERRVQMKAVRVGAEFERALQNGGAGAGPKAAVEQRAASNPQ